MNIAKKLVAVLAAVAGLSATPQAGAEILGAKGTNFIFTAKAGTVSTADGNSVPMWGFALDGGAPQYPGPTLILNQGDTVSIRLDNTLPMPVSMVFPGQEGVAASGGSEGVLAREAPPGGSVTYSFTVTRPGTFTYHSGTRPDLQIEMGLAGAMVVRPGGYDEATNRIAHDHPDSRFDREYLLVLSEMDPNIHQLAAQGRFDDIRTTGYFPVYWFLNGRTAPDTLAQANVGWLPHQPYNALPRMHPGERLLMRVVNIGRQSHPFHHHGNHALTLARDGQLLSSGPGAGADLATLDFTIQAVPGQTHDAIFEWTGKGLGWDIYGHTADEPCLIEHGEDCSVHGKGVPVTMPAVTEMALGAHFSGSPFLGGSEAVPPGEGGMNANGGLYFMWHSHNEKEMTNFDIFPGGMMTMVIIEPPGVVIDGSPH
ncbi:MAG: multicopper oxidase family protein [Pseudomonadota bacterium]